MAEQPESLTPESFFLVDTSVWIAIFRETKLGKSLRERTGNTPCVLTHFNQLELLQGARDEPEWRLLNEYLQSQINLECSDSTWSSAARIYFELRREGKTVRSPIDCCIAQLAIEHNALLLHRDHDFDTIGEVRPLRKEWF